MREIKYRQPLFYNGHFRKFHYWGDIDGGFQSPVAGNLGRNSQEYTGLLDKNGKEVFVGDIVSPINFDGSYRDAIVKFRNGCFIVESMGMCKDYECLGDKIGFKIIGNIYENPELIR